MIRVLVVAPYAAVRAGLQVLLSEAEECIVVSQAGGSGELESLLPDARPDVVIVDEDAGARPEALAIVAASGSALVLLADTADSLGSVSRLPLRGWAYLGKEAGAAELAAAVRAAHAGLIVLDPAVAVAVAGAAPGVGPIGTGSSAEALTSREREVLQLMAEGLPNKTIASRLGITLHTVKFHVAAILGKLGAGSRTEAVTLAARRGDLIL
jgi:two-component system nitrate/nitrite response regulator NarL